VSGPGWLLRVLGGLPKPTKRPTPDDEPPGPLTREHELAVVEVRKGGERGPEHDLSCSVHPME